MAEKPINLKDSLKELNAIVAWFEAQEEIDVEAGLEKVKVGALLVKSCKQRLTEIENEFEQIQREVEGADTKESATPVARKKVEKTPEKTDDIDPDDIPF